jgi:hypothetical protein
MDWAGQNLAGHSLGMFWDGEGTGKLWVGLDI